MIWKRFYASLIKNGSEWSKHFVLKSNMNTWSVVLRNNISQRLLPLTCGIIAAPTTASLGSEWDNFVMLNLPRIVARVYVVKSRTKILLGSFKLSITSKWCSPWRTIIFTPQFSAKIIDCSKKTGRSSPPTQTVTGQIGFGINAGLSAVAVSSVSRKSLFISVNINVRKSATAEIGTICVIREIRSSDSTSGTPNRATRWPPAECPVSAITGKKERLKNIWTKTASRVSLL